jgi:cobalt/nickel transport system permease protein
MWRYLHVLAGEVSRMKRAREARGYLASWFWQAASTGPLIATLFVRSLQRGERVYLAMMGGLYDGSMPETVTGPLQIGKADMLFLAAIIASLTLVIVVLV